ncbi:sensor histidine kinase [Puia sp.]|uniref:sensor histidine kinase n=1 Tax=Puia sp. TaxID=2045100 RepID=UPI002F41761F
MRRPLTLIWLLLLVHSLYAQQYLFALYTPKDGLINNRARFLYQDSRGRLYVSTYGGLSVYDGSRFINYTTDNGLATSLINDILEMGDDSLWIAPNGTALHCLVHGVIRDIHTADGFYPVVNQLVRCSDGILYGISDYGLFRYQHNRWIRVPLQDGQGRTVDGPIVQAVEIDHRLLILTDRFSGAYPGPSCLLLYDPTTQRVTIAAKHADFYYLVKAPGTGIFVTTSAGIRRLDPAALQQDSIRLLHLSAPWQAADPILCGYAYFDRHHDLWLPLEQGLIRIDSATGSLQSFTTANGLPPGATTAVLQDAEDNIWFANDRNGIVKWPGRRVASYARPQPGFTVNDLCTVAGTDSVWFYDNNRRSLLLMRDSTRQLFLPEGDVPNNSRVYFGVNSWITAGNDLYSLHFLPGHRFRAVPFRHDSSFRFGGGCIDKKGNLILVSDKLTVVLTRQLPVVSARQLPVVSSHHSPAATARQPTPLHPLLQYPLPYFCDQVTIDSAGRIWTVSRSDELRVFGLTMTDTGPRLNLLAAFEGPPGSARSITVDNAGHAYIGTRDHGLYCLFFKDLRFLYWKHLTTRNGLSENYISNLQCDADNTVWVCTPAGLDRIRYADSCFTIDNLTYNHDNYQGVYKIHSTRDGVHWALVMQGYMKIGPFPAKRTNYSPQILFSEVLVDNVLTPNTPTTPLSLHYDHNTMTFHIGVTSFIDEAQTRYSYLLEGSSNHQWSPPTSESAIHFVNLPPGKYTLRVKVQFLAGDYPDGNSSYPFVIHPPWWQTAGFRAVLLLVIATLTFLGIRAYIRRRLLHQRLELENQQAIEKERTRIATDMHDELGAGLSRIKFLSETIGIKKQQQLPFEEEITGIRRYSHEMIDKMGEIVWALNERNDSLSDLLSYTRSYAAEYLLQGGIRCQVETPADLPSGFVSGEFRRNVYLTIKEALHNIVKHAQAEQVDIRMAVQPGKFLLITIADDGIGFDRERIRPFANGINNMQRRIRDLGGTLAIFTGPGTTIRLSIPL